MYLTLQIMHRMQVFMHVVFCWKFAGREFNSMELKDTVKKASEGTSEKILGNASEKASGSVSKSVAGRLRFVDIAKGISIICIILGHLGIHNITRVVFTFHVPIFFLITGYFVSRKEGVRDFAIKKARTLLVPYFVTSLVMIAVAAGLGLRDGACCTMLRSGRMRRCTRRAGGTTSRSISRRSARSGSCGRASGDACSCARRWSWRRGYGSR